MARKRQAGKRRRRRRSRAGRWVLRLALACSLVLAGALSVAFLDANWRFARRTPPPPVRIYSASFTLREGTTLSQTDLVERLTRLGYRKVEGRPRTPGEYAQRFRSFEIVLNGFDYPEGAADPLPLRVRISSGRVAALENYADGRDLDSARLEPEPLGILSGDIHEERVPVSLNEVPRALKEAVIAVEDRRFLRHPGIDLHGVLRAFVANLRSGEVVQGGSTITQQLAKNLYQSQDSRTVARKIWETLAAVSI